MFKLVRPSPIAIAPKKLKDTLARQLLAEQSVTPAVHHQQHEEGINQNKPRTRQPLSCLFTLQSHKHGRLELKTTLPASQAPIRDKAHRHKEKASNRPRICQRTPAAFLPPILEGKRTLRLSGETRGTGQIIYLTCEVGPSPSAARQGLFATAAGGEAKILRQAGVAETRGGDNLLGCKGRPTTLRELARLARTFLASLKVQLLRAFAA